MQKNSLNSAVVIPALNPLPNLPDFVRELLACGVPQVLVVNDGSASSFNDIFREIAQLRNCTVLEHIVNRGKGRALKTAFANFLEHFSDLDGVVTADADGQHTVEDICLICEKLSEKQAGLILGVRDFSGNNVPRRSYIGNLVTSRIFGLLYGGVLGDTQTGLRGIPTKELTWMVEMKGERYDYEINMLIKAKQRNLVISTPPITTLYFDNNSGSHYSTFRDSWPIILCLASCPLNYFLSTLITSPLDILGFFVLNSCLLTDLSAPIRIFASTAIARVISSAFNYILNRKLIFVHTGNLANSVIRYYILCVLQMLASCGLVYSLSLFWMVNESIIKLIIDSTLGFVGYQFQLRWVFRNKVRAKASFPTAI